MDKFFKFFLGTPRKFLVSVVTIVIGMTIVHFYPGAVARSINRLVAECWPLVEVILILIIVLAGFRLIVGWRGGGKK